MLPLHVLNILRCTEYPQCTEYPTVYCTADALWGWNVFYELNATSSSFRGGGIKTLDFTIFDVICALFYTFNSFSGSLFIEMKHRIFPGPWVLGPTQFLVKNTTRCYAVLKNTELCIWPGIVCDRAYYLTVNCKRWVTEIRPLYLIRFFLSFICGILFAIDGS